MGGFEPPTAGPKPAVLPITPHPIVTKKLWNATGVESQPLYAKQM